MTWAAPAILLALYWTFTRGNREPEADIAIV
jgi:hypothetical protein